MIGKYLKDLRKRKNITLDSLVDKVGFSQSHLSQLERGARLPKEDKLKKILINGFDMKPSEAEYTIQRWQAMEAISKLSEQEQLKLVRHLNQMFGDKYILLPKEIVGELRAVQEYMDKREERKGEE